MGKWIKKTAATPLTSESKIINDQLTEEDPNVNGFSIAVIRNITEQIIAVNKLYVDSNYQKRSYAEFENPENFITLRAGDTLNRVSFVKSNGVIYFSAIITLNSDVESNAPFFTINDSLSTYGVIVATYAFDAMGMIGSNARSFAYDPTSKAFTNTGATVSASQVLRVSTSWAVH